MLDPVLIEVRRLISARNLSLPDAALQIGVGVTSLQKHLDGGYVRSDSLAKYRRWLNAGDRLGISARAPQIADAFRAEPTSDVDPLQCVDPLLGGQRLQRLNVVDLFCGCGGMSLGFERFGAGKVFRTAMALDIEAPMVRVFNDNHPSASSEIGIGRQVDITDFSSEAEVHAFYLDHLARTTGNHLLSEQLDRMGLGVFRRSVGRVDAAFVAELVAIRKHPDYVASVRTLGSAATGQTSVVGFHNALKLPATGTQAPRLGPLIWFGDSAPATEGASETGLEIDEHLLERARRRARRRWDAEVAKLVERSLGTGRGQLASAAERIDRFMTFLSSRSAHRMRSVWTDWAARREALRSAWFGDQAVAAKLQTLYESGHRVSVLLGGPPCQGFSRIGRGKIRSLREQSVHVHQDDDTVDSRNQLMHQYVLFVAALAPDVFLFENVRHFQAVVRSEGVEFDAADVLAEAISAVSSKGLGYRIDRRIVIASQHAVPQNRERFVMAGVRDDVVQGCGIEEVPKLCLALQWRPPVPLKTALDGLPSPAYTNDGTHSVGVVSVAGTPPISSASSASQTYVNWTRTSATTDAHLARPPRSDDAALFAKMGPGTRWMDYRCDDAPTLSRLAAVLKQLDAAVSSDKTLARRLGVSPDEIKQLVTAADGSLTLRLLLECVKPQPGEVAHHLLTPTYLAKREGAHGDWLARMDASQPSKTVVSHMAKDTYAFVHPFEPRTLSVREAARIQAFPDDYRFGSVGLVDGFRVVGNAVPPLLSLQFAERVAKIISLVRLPEQDTEVPAAVAA